MIVAIAACDLLISTLSDLRQRCLSQKEREFDKQSLWFPRSMFAKSDEHSHKRGRDEGIPEP